jgi:YqaJ-like viral recombinase domain
LRLLSEHSDGAFLNGSDAQTVTGNDVGALIQLWRKKRGAVKRSGALNELGLQLGKVTKDLNRRWCEKETGYAISGGRRVVHPVHRWMVASLDGRIQAIEAVFEAEFVGLESLSEEEVTRKFNPQLQHDMWVTASRCAVLSIITGGGGWMGMMIYADPLAQHLLLTAERKFWRCVQNGEPPRLFTIDLPRPRIERIGAVENKHSLSAESDTSSPATETSESLVQPASPDVGTEVVYIRKPVRERDQHHLQFVRTQPCLICARRPTDAHHVKVAQVTAMGRKVSDRFTVPLCRLHHLELHQRGNERPWWQDKGIDPLAVAAALWRRTHDDDPDEEESTAGI